MSAQPAATGVPAREAGTAQGLVLLAAAIMPIMAITALIPVLPALLREFGHVPGSAALVPVALTVPALCVALFSPLAGWLSDRFGRKRLLVGSLVLYAGFGFLPWFLADLFTIIGARIALGVVEAAIMTITTALIGDYFTGERRERWIALQVMVGSIGATALLAAGGLLGDLFGSRGPFLLYLSSLGVALAAAVALHEPVRRGTRERDAGPRGLGVLRLVLPLAAITFGVGFAFYTVFVQIGPILEAVGDVTPGMVGIAGAVVNLGVVTGAVIFKRASAQAGPGLLALGLLAAAAGYAGVAAASDFYAITLSATLACFGTGIMLPNMLTWTMRSLPQAVRGQGMGIWTGSFFLGQFVAPLAVGALAGPAGGVRIVIGLLGAVILAAALAAFLASRRPPAAAPSI